MSYKTKIEIKEPLNELRKVYQSSKNERIRLKVKSLILFKENKLGKQEKIAIHLSISHCTFKRWLREYNERGLRSLLTIKEKGKPKSLIDPEVKQALKLRLNDITNPFSGYLDVQRWLKETYHIDIQYATVRNYLIKNFRSRIKTTKTRRFLQIRKMD